MQHSNRGPQRAASHLGNLLTDRRSFLKMAGATMGVAATAQTALPTEHRPTPLRLLGMGDPQIGCPFGDWATKVPAAMRDLRNLGHDRHIIVGDLVQNAAHYYNDYQSLIVDQASSPILTLAGNGDVNAGLDHYYAATGTPDLHFEYVRGIRLILCGTTYMSPPPPGGRHICHLGYEQTRQLANLLASDTTTTTLVFSHAPFKDTTWRSGIEPDRNEMWLDEGPQLRALFSMYPNVVFYGSGHVHYTYGWVDTLGYDGWYVDPANGVVHHSIGDTCRGRGSTMIEVHSDGLRLRVRDHLDGTGEWRDQFEKRYAFPTTLI